MASLLNKLTGHTSDKDATTNADKHHHSSTQGAHTGTTGSMVGNNNLQQSSTSTTANQQTSTTGSNPYGTTGVMNSGAAYTSSNSGMTNTHNTTGTTMRDDAITRSEEQLRVGKERVNTGKAELNKYVTTEHVQQPVTVTRERAVIEREPINASNMDKALSGPPISEAHYETTLKSDVVQAEKEVVPIERIRLAKQTETTTQNVGADLRKEHVDFTHTKMANENLTNNNLRNSNNMSYNSTTPNKEY